MLWKNKLVRVEYILVSKNHWKLKVYIIGTVNGLPVVDKHIPRDKYIHAVKIFFAIRSAKVERMRKAKLKKEQLNGPQPKLPEQLKLF